MTKEEQAKQEIISIFSDAGKDIQYWMEYLKRNEINKLLDAVLIVRAAKETALRRRQHKLQ